MATPHPLALVTGASRGIGRAVAEALTATGHRVFATARDPARLAEAVGELAGQGPGCEGRAFDLRQPGAAEALLEACRETLGEPEVVVSNAGTAPSAPVERTTDEMLDEVLALHVRAPLALARGVLPAMRARGSGCLVHIASTAGLRGFAYTTAYTAAKHAMVGLARALAAELGEGGVRAYAVCPGFVDTDITRQAAAAVAARGRQSADQVLAAMAAQNRIGRLLQPDEVASAAVMLCRERPAGCVYDLDRQPPSFLEPLSQP